MVVMAVRLKQLMVVEILELLVALHLLAVM
jgi:hypothetical protein